MEQQEKRETITEDAVREYLTHHPDFLTRNPELLEILTIPAEDNGEGVIDMRQYMLRGLQKQLQESKHRFAEMVGCLRDNISSQNQIHKAILALVKCHDLRSLLHIIMTDLPTIFGLDAVHIAIETEHQEFFTEHYPESFASAISFAPAGLSEHLFDNKTALLIEDTSNPRLRGMEYLFTHCPDLIHSAALVRIRLETMGNDAILAFGVREKGRFTPHQGTELLTFLAEVIEYRLDATIYEFNPENFPDA